MGLFSGLNEIIVDSLRDTEFQQKNKFEFIIVRNPGDYATSYRSFGINVAEVAIGVIGLVADLLISKFYVQKIDFGEGGVEYERIGTGHIPKNVLYADSVIITFLETEDGWVRRYLTQWMGEIVRYDYGTESWASALRLLALSWGAMPYVFDSNQNKSKRLAMLWPQSGVEGDFPLVPRVMFKGLKMKQNGALSFGQDDDGNLIYSVECTVDAVEIPFLI